MSSIYTLYLSTLITQNGIQNNTVPINKSNLANVSWNINWDDLFNGENQNNKFSKCRLRYNLISTSSAALTLVNGTGYLTLSGFSNSFQSSYVPCLILGMINPDFAPIVASVNSQLYYNINTLSEQGVSSSMPNGTSQISVRFYNDDAQTLMTNIPEYTLLLQFELYN